jgi:hypothetical protein
MTADKNWTGEFSLQNRSNKAFHGAVYGVPPHNRCSIVGTDEGKAAYGYLQEKGKRQIGFILLCSLSGNSLEWRAMGGTSL